MTPPHDIHVASDAERRAAWVNVHEVWGGNRTVEESVRWREQSAQCRRATWWVLTEGGAVLSSLGCYPLEVSVRGRTVGAFGFGAVYTVPAARRRGLVGALCRAVIDDCRARGRVVGLLFSEIGTDYYGRMGFRAVEERKARCDEPARLAAGGPRAALAPVDAASCLPRLAALYDAHHAHTELFLARSPDYWRYSLAKMPDGEFLLVGRGRERVADAAAGVEVDPAAGYARVARSRDGETLYVDEIALPGATRQAAEAVWRALGALAGERGCARVTAWIEPPPGVAAHFDRQPRSSVTMVCSLDPEVSLPATLTARTCAIYATDHF